VPGGFVVMVVGVPVGGGLLPGLEVVVVVGCGLLPIGHWPNTFGTQIPSRPTHGHGSLLALVVVVVMVVGGEVPGGFVVMVVGVPVGGGLLPGLEVVVVVGCGLLPIGHWPSTFGRQIPSGPTHGHGSLLALVVVVVAVVVGEVLVPVVVVRVVVGTVEVPVDMEAVRQLPGKANVQFLHQSLLSRIAEKVQWYLFVNAGPLYVFESEEETERARPEHRDFGTAVQVDVDVVLDLVLVMVPVPVLRVVVVDLLVASAEFPCSLLLAAAPPLLPPPPIDAGPSRELLLELALLSLLLALLLLLLESLTASGDTPATAALGVLAAVPAESADRAADLLSDVELELELELVLVLRSSVEELEEELLWLEVLELELWLLLTAGALPNHPSEAGGSTIAAAFAKPTLPCDDDPPMLRSRCELAARSRSASAVARWKSCIVEVCSV
jgi:hypothetical protein